ncbi:MAG: metal-binding protein, partial [Merismopedia sp. SIO2A8]|nr:metal-binding protein [Merismopedia sp. SIO2A8]
GRLVWNHSTHLPGLIPILKRLIQCPGIDTVTPAVLKTVRSNAQTFRLKVSVPIQGGFKLIARKGKTAQEVFVVTNLSQGQLEDAIAHSVKKSKR